MIYKPPLFTANLFSTNLSRYAIAYRYMVELIAVLPTVHDIVFICGDSTVLLDSSGVWKDLAHEIMWDYDEYTPCDPARKPDGEHDPPLAFTTNEKWV